MKKFTTVDEFIANFPEWQEALKKLRSLLTTTEMVETIKWGAPVYTVNGKNVIGLGAFKSYVGMWFFQGAFLRDSPKKLINAQEGKTKALRQWRFHSVDEIDEKLVLEYALEAIENQKAGKEIKPQRKPLHIPPELKQAFANNAALDTAFKKMSLTKRREYVEHIDSAKREATKMSRLEKIIPMILKGVGLNDKYRDC